MIKEYKIINKINKGWSNDKKYLCIKDNKYFLLRKSKYTKEKELEIKYHNKLLDKKIPIQKIIEYETNNDLIDIIYEYIDGFDLDEKINTYNKGEQYKLGLESGKYLKEIQKIDESINLDWEYIYNLKIDKKINNYLNCGIKIDNDKEIINYINNNRYLLKNRKVTYQHGDYHIGNLLIDKNNKIRIIDFNRNSYGDPYEEFNRIIFDYLKSEDYLNGFINGYINPDTNFFKLIKLYQYVNIISSIPWSINFGFDETNTMINNSKLILNYYKENYIPNWYKKR